MYRRFIRHFLLTFYWPLFIMKRMLRLVSNLWSISVMPPQRGISLTNNIFSSDNNWNGCEYTCTKSNLFVDHIHLWSMSEAAQVILTFCTTSLSFIYTKFLFWRCLLLGLLLMRIMSENKKHLSLQYIHIFRGVC